MGRQFDPKRFVVRERFRFWSDMSRKSGETVPELAARIRQAAATCGFTNIRNPLDEALRTRFICSVNNEAVLKALFKINDDELTFSRAIEIASETEDAAKVAKETVFGTAPAEVRQIRRKVSRPTKPTQKSINLSDRQRLCYRCGNPAHLAPDCPHKNAVCNYCKVTGHLSKVCRKKRSLNASQSSEVKCIQDINTISDVVSKVPRLEKTIFINSVPVTLELDTATSGNFITSQVWSELGKPKLIESKRQYHSASKHAMPIKGTFTAITACDSTNKTASLEFLVSKLDNLNLLGRDAIKILGLSIDHLMYGDPPKVYALQDLAVDTALQETSSRLCDINLHQNADALSRLPASEDPIFNSEESTGDEDIVCAIDTLERQIKSADSSSMPKETLRDPVLSLVMRFTREGWPICKSRDDPIEAFRKISDSLSSCYDCLLYGTRVVIPSSLRKHVLELLHEGHFGIQRMKQLARTAVYWPNIDMDITDMCQRCSTCAVHQPLPSKAPLHPWMVPEKPWSRLHIDHAVNFMGCNWLVMIDSHSKYPCIHPTSSVSSISTMRLLESDFAHFGYPHTLVSDNSTSFMSDEFQLFCKERGIVHLTGAPYHPATNGAAERLVRTFKQALTKSSKPPKEALQEFLMMYRRTPTACGFSPSELLNSRQIRTKIDTLVVSPLQIPSNPCKVKPEKKVVNVINDLNVGDPVYALCFRPHRSHDPRWVPAIILKKRGERLFRVKVVPRGPVWRRHLDQLRFRHASSEDSEPGDVPSRFTTEATRVFPRPTEAPIPRSPIQQREVTNYGPQNPRRSGRQRRQPQRYGYEQ